MYSTSAGIYLYLHQYGYFVYMFIILMLSEFYLPLIPINLGQGFIFHDEANHALWRDRSGSKLSALSKALLMGNGGDQGFKGEFMSHD